MTCRIEMPEDLFNEMNVRKNNSNKFKHQHINIKKKNQHTYQLYTRSREDMSQQQYTTLHDPFVDSQVYY